MAVSRTQVIQSCLDLFEAPRYLEVGVATGATFLPLRATLKVAVDPGFAEGVAERIAAQDGAQAHALTSDAYFGGPAGRQVFDVIYLDGLHTFEQTLRDLLNAVAHLAGNGIVIVDDVVPSSYGASLPDPGVALKVRKLDGVASGNWMGDVYRLTFFVDSFMQQFRYGTIGDNHGQLVAWRAARAAVTERSVEAVARMPYEAITVEEGTLRRAPFQDILAELSRDLGLAPGAPKGLTPAA